MIDGLLTSIVHRPYVFSFLAAYLFLACRRWGWRRAIIWLVTGYFIAWLSEYSSINNGFPYGEYHYIYSNLEGELLVAGVPFFDSLSYPFLIFAGFTMGESILGSAISRSRYLTISRIFLGSLFTMLLDVIIDPIATMGDKWFLGKIHYYAHPGWYFGVPVTNFAGWFFVSLVIISTNLLLWKTRVHDSTVSRSSDLTGFFYPAIALFNIAVTFWIGEWKMGIASSIILTAILAGLTPSLLASRFRQRISV